MNSKITQVKIGIILGSAVVASATVYAAIAHHRHAVAAAATTINPPVQQLLPIPKPAAGTPLNSEPDGNQVGSQADAVNSADQQSSGASNDPNQNQASADDETASSNPDQQAIVIALQKRAQPAIAASVRTVSRVRVVKAAQPAVAAEIASVDIPAKPVVAVKAPAFVVPSGTEFTLRLEEPLGSKISQPDQTFAATLDHDIELHGRTVIAAGARVTGKVVKARPAGRLAGEATLQLQITSVKVNRREVEVLTAVRSFGPTIQGKNKVGRFMKGIAKRMDGEENEVLLAEQTAYSFSLSSPLELR